MFCQHMYSSFFTIKKINHNHPFPSSFRAGVEKRTVVSLQSLSRITRKQGALVSSITERYAHNAVSLVQNVLGSCIAESILVTTKSGLCCCH